ncbi:hypothetical protein JG688_00014331 [Phytophthora aleatoria]|uniref:DOT1 domain-containing protein n=1 Tax=Phytophthora aleatoria TaxID=2496075 RepID=A0A8J5ME13_9STRA|nr:hypothetical protein JG688_00014331 [Phytophthora aleatoria]
MTRQCVSRHYRFLRSQGRFRQYVSARDVRQQAAGIGNVVALTTTVGVCIGVEVRAELSKLSEGRSQEHLETFPHLCKIRVISLDVRDAFLSSRSPLCEATLVFANNFLFEDEGNLVLAHELCEMRRVRVVATIRLFCPRHRAPFTQPFCTKWTTCAKSKYHAAGNHRYMLTFYIK